MTTRADPGGTAGRRTVGTMCPMNCHPTLCGMQATVADGRLVSIAGDPANPDSLGYLCMRGKAAHEIVGNDRRLLFPQTRARPGAGDWRRTGWDATLDLVAGRMAAAGREAVGIWQGHGTAANDYGFGLKRRQVERFANLYGCQVWDPAMICWGLGGFGFGLTGALRTSTKEDMGAHSRMVVLWGANTVSQAHTIRHVEEARRRGAHVVVIDVRRTEAGALADEVVLVRPGTDAALALGLMHVILAEGLWDRDFVAAHTSGFEALKAHVAAMTPERAAALTGVPARRIAALGRRYGRTRPAMIVAGGSSLHKGANGWQAARAISCLPALTGDYGRPGGGLGPRHGARSTGAGFADIAAEDRRPPGRRVPEQLEAIVRALETGEVKVLLMLGANMLSSFPDAGRLRAALARADLVVAYDIFSNQTIREAAHVVLPGTIWLEEIGAKATNTHLHLCEPALPPAGEARPLHTIWRDLATRLGVEDVYPWADQEAAIDAVLDHPATGRATLAQIRAMGGHLPLRVSPVAYPGRVFDTPSGRIEFRSARAEAMGLPPLPEAGGAAPEDGMLTLAHGRTFAHFHAFYDNGRALPTLAAREPGPVLWIAPDDAAARGISDGDPVEMRNARGAFRAQAKVTARMPPGAVWIRDGWPGLNALTDGASVLPDTALGAFGFSVGQADFGARVQVRRVQGGSTPRR